MRIDIQARGFDLTQGLREHAEADLYAAIDRAAERTERTLARRLGQLREPRRLP